MNLVPPSLVGCAALGISSASLGAGIRVRSGPLRYARGNLFVLAIAQTGVGKDSALLPVMRPFTGFEQGLMERWKAGAPSAAAELGVLEHEYDRHKKDASKAGDAATRMSYVRLATEAGEKIEALKKRVIQPVLSVGDVTKEKLGVIMAEQVGEAVASISAEARGIVDVLCGRYSNNGSSDEDFYTASYSGTPVKFDRLGREKVQLYRPCLTLLWMLQPDKFYSLLGNHGIADSGMFPDL